MGEGWVCRCGRGTLYDVLQVSPWCEPEVIQAAFRALARSRHPDVNRSVDAEEQMRRLNVAYQTLSDPALRARYDEELALEAARPMTVRPAPAAGYGYASGPAARPSSAASGAGARPGAGAGPASGSGAAGGGPAGASASVAQSAYQSSLFDTRGEMVLPRSTVYVSVVMIVVIVVLIVMLMTEYLADGTSTPTRTIRTPAGILNTGGSSASALPPGATWTFNLSGPSAEPGLSQPRTR